MTTPPKRELRTIHSTTHVRGGTLIITQVVDLDALVERVSQGEQLGPDLPGAAEVALEHRGKAAVLAKASSLAEADAFVAGWVACATARTRAKKATPSGRKKRAQLAGDEP